MPDLNVDADLIVDDGVGGERQFSVEDLKTALTGNATEATLADVLTALGLVTVDGEVSLSAATLTALETITVANPTADPETGLATAAKQDALVARLPAALDNGSLDVADVFTDGETLADQAGAGAVLTFTFAAPVDLIWVRSVGDVARADPFGGTPSATAGIYCADDEPTPITVRATVVAVWAPSGATVAVWGFRS